MMPAGKNPEPRKRLKKIVAFTYPVEEYIPLPKIRYSLKPTFLQIINNRKSERKFAKLTLKQISNLLWHSSKVKTVSVTNENQILTHRNVPSAGAIHPIDIFISLPEEFEKRILYYYDPFTHKLAKVKLSKAALLLFFQNVNNNLDIKDATLIWFAANINRTESKYKNPESLIWRDAGALVMLFQLVATALKIKSCPIGTLANPFFSDLFPKNNNIISAGGLLFG